MSEPLENQQLVLQINVKDFKKYMNIDIVKSMQKKPYKECLQWLTIKESQACISFIYSNDYEKVVNKMTDNKLFKTELSDWKVNIKYDFVKLLSKAKASDVITLKIDGGYLYYHINDILVYTSTIAQIETDCFGKLVYNYIFNVDNYYIHNTTKNEMLASIDRNTGNDTMYICRKDKAYYESDRELLLDKERLLKALRLIETEVISIAIPKSQYVKNEYTVILFESGENASKKVLVNAKCIKKLNFSIDSGNELITQENDNIKIVYK